MRNLLEQTDGTKSILDECIDFVEKSDEVIIFGAGVGGTILFDLLEENELSNKVCCYSDNNRLKHDTYLKNKLIISPIKLMEVYPNAKVIIASSAYPEIKRQLKEYGYSEEVIKLYNFAFSELDYTDKEFIYNHLEDFERAYNYMSDDKSRNIIINILNYKITKDNKWLEKLNVYVDDEKYQYFDKELIDFSNIKNFVDVGSYIGDTFEQAEQLEIKYENYYCFEADPHVFGVLKKNIGNKPNIELNNIGLWNKKTRLSFSNVNPGSSTVTIIEDNKDEENYIEVDKLDNLLLEQRVDFLKLDIEGAEFEALTGMEQVINKNLPVITFAVYHKRDDYFMLLDLINKFAPDQYAFYFRQYRYTPTETICYAIPNLYMNTN